MRPEYNHKIIQGSVAKINIGNIGEQACREYSPVRDLCKFFFGAICGMNSERFETDADILTRVLRFISSTGSVKQVVHYLQLVFSGKFRQFDYKSDNMAKYNSLEPPNYKLKNVKRSIYIYSGSCDPVVSEVDLEILKENLPNVRKHKVLKNFNHCDFNYSQSLKT